MKLVKDRFNKERKSNAEKMKQMEKVISKLKTKLGKGKEVMLIVASKNRAIGQKLKESEIALEELKEEHDFFLAHQHICEAEARDDMSGECVTKAFKVITEYMRKKVLTTLNIDK